MKQLTLPFTRDELGIIEFSLYDLSMNEIIAIKLQTKATAIRKKIIKVLDLDFDSRTKVL